MDLRHLALILDAAGTAVSAELSYSAVYSPAARPVLAALRGARDQAVALHDLENGPLEIADDADDAVQMPGGDVLDHLFRALRGRIAAEQEARAASYRKDLR